MLGSIISAGASLIGGAMSRKSSKDANAANAEISAQNAEMQKEFAQNGIRWKVNDAKAAGIHPLYALGANTHSFSPSAVGVSPDTSMGDAFSRAGQDIGRAIDAGSTMGERQQARMNELQIKRGELENTLLASRIARLNANPTIGVPTSSPSGYIEGQNPMIQPSPNTEVFEEPTMTGREVGSVADYGFSRTPNGLAIVPSSGVKSRIEDLLIPQLLWSLRNTHIFSKPPYPTGSAADLPSGKRWAWHPLIQEYRPYSPASRRSVHRSRHSNRY